MTMLQRKIIAHQPEKPASGVSFWGIPRMIPFAIRSTIGVIAALPGRALNLFRTPKAEALLPLTDTGDRGPAVGETVAPTPKSPAVAAFDGLIGLEALQKAQHSSLNAAYAAVRLGVGLLPAAYSAYQGDSSMLLKLGVVFLVSGVFSKGAKGRVSEEAQTRVCLVLSGIANPVGTSTSLAFLKGATFFTKNDEQRAICYVAGLFIADVGVVRFVADSVQTADRRIGSDPMRSEDSSWAPHRRAGDRQLLALGDGSDVTVNFSEMVFKTGTQTWAPGCDFSRNGTTITPDNVLTMVSKNRIAGELSLPASLARFNQTGSLVFTASSVGSGSAIMLQSSQRPGCNMTQVGIELYSDRVNLLQRCFLGGKLQYQNTSTMLTPTSSSVSRTYVLELPVGKERALFIGGQYMVAVPGVSDSNHALIIQSAPCIAGSGGSGRFSVQGMKFKTDYTPLARPEFTMGNDSFTRMNGPLDGSDCYLVIENAVVEGRGVLLSTAPIQSDGALFPVFCAQIESKNYLPVAKAITTTIQTSGRGTTVLILKGMPTTERGEFNIALMIVGGAAGSNRSGYFEIQRNVFNGAKNAYDATRIATAQFDLLHPLSTGNHSVTFVPAYDHTSLLINGEVVAKLPRTLGADHFKFIAQQTINTTQTANLLSDVRVSELMVSSLAEDGTAFNFSGHPFNIAYGIEGTDFNEVGNVKFSGSDLVLTTKSVSAGFFPVTKSRVDMGDMITGMRTVKGRYDLTGAAKPMVIFQTPKANNAGPFKQMLFFIENGVANVVAQDFIPEGQSYIVNGTTSDQIKDFPNSGFLRLFMDSQKGFGASVDGQEPRFIGLPGDAVVPATVGMFLQNGASGTSGFLMGSIEFTTALELPGEAGRFPDWAVIVISVVGGVVLCGIGKIVTKALIRCPEPTSSNAFGV